MTIGPNGNLFVTDFQNGVLQFNGQTGAYMGVFAATHNNAFDYKAVFANGNLYVGISGGAIQEFNGSTGAYVGLFANTPGGSGDFGGMAAAQDGSILATYLNNSNLYRYSSTGALTGIFAGTDGGNGPRSPVIGANGNIYVPVWQSGDIAKFSGTGNSLGYLTRSASSPIALSVESNGNLLSLSDYSSGGDSISVYNATTGTKLETLVSGLNRADALLAVGNVTPVPLPAAFWLMASGILALGGVARRRRS
jgi:outer membrane protein assembly factor BamB